jgi:hypothetical protein
MLHSINDKENNKHEGKEDSVCSQLPEFIKWTKTRHIIDHHTQNKYKEECESQLSKKQHVTYFIIKPWKMKNTRVILAENCITLQVI